MRWAQTALKHGKGLVPRDRLEIPGAALAARLPARRLHRRAGETCFMMPAEPLAQITPWLSGWLGLP